MQSYDGTNGRTVKVDLGIAPGTNGTHSFALGTVLRAYAEYAMVSIVLSEGANPVRQTLHAVGYDSMELVPTNEIPENWPFGR